MSDSDEGRDRCCVQLVSEVCKIPTTNLGLHLEPGRLLPPKCFALSYAEALHVADEMGWTKTDSWLTGGRHKLRGYSTTAPSVRLRTLLLPFTMTPEKWRQKVTCQPGAVH
jgi:hypothetical protein